MQKEALASSPSNKVFFHCGAGISRGPTSCTAFLMYKLGLSAADALNLVRERRKCIRPNVGFVAALKKWERKTMSRREKRAQPAKASRGAVKVLFAFKDVDGEMMFVELKRPQFKGSADKSRYVSWFRVLSVARRAERLTFVSWDGDTREFVQGTLNTPQKGEKCFVGKDGPAAGAAASMTKKTVLETLPSEHISEDVIEMCLDSWTGT